MPYDNVATTTTTSTKQMATFSWAKTLVFSFFFCFINWKNKLNWINLIFRRSFISISVDFQLSSKCWSIHIFFDGNIVFNEIISFRFDAFKGTSCFLNKSLCSLCSLSSYRKEKKNEMNGIESNLFHFCYLSRSFAYLTASCVTQASAENVYVTKGYGRNTVANCVKLLYTLSFCIVRTTVSIAMCFPIDGNE